MSLRDYQQECLEAIHDGWLHQVESQLVVIPTAGGKTVIFSHLPQYHRMAGTFGQMLVLVHRDKLVQQNAEKIQYYNPHLVVEIEAGTSRADPDAADVIVGSVQTLQHAKRRERFNPKTIDVVIVDEAHHSISPMYTKILEYFQVYKGGTRVSGKLLVGFTATPKRGDSIGLEKVFDKIIFSRSIREGVEGKWLVEPQGYRVSTLTDISDVGTKGGDFKEGQLSSAVDTYERNRLVVEQYKKLAPGLTFAAFTVTIAHSEHLADVFRSYGVSCKAISGDTREGYEGCECGECRHCLYRMHDSGELLGLCSCGVLSEGWDNPRCTVALLTRPTKSSGLYIQQLGRVLRPFPSPENLVAFTEQGITPAYLKQFAVVIDFCDQTGRHQVVTLPSLFGLRADFDLAGKSATKTSKKIEELLRQTPGLDIEGATSLRQIEALVQKVNLLGPIRIPAEVTRMSKLGWVRDGINGYRLTLPEKMMTTLYIAENALGNWEAYKSVNGQRQILYTGKLEDAFLAGDAAVPRDALGTVLANAKWHADPPTVKQCWALFYRDGNLRKQYHYGQGVALYQFAIKQFNAGNTEWSKGGISRRMDALAEVKKARA